MTCAECGREYSNQAAACVQCGARNPTRTSAGAVLGKIVLVIVGLFVAFMVLGAILVANDPDADARNKDRDAINYCEDTYAQLKDDPRMTQGALGIAYGACEKMKEDYRAKWNREP
jgi:hypothetical protein